jgi:hypothetical protein
MSQAEAELTGQFDAGTGALGLVINMRALRPESVAVPVTFDHQGESCPQHQLDSISSQYSTYQQVT